jgi:hypothetical protein
MAGQRRDDRPVFLVNPSLEQVGLRRGEDNSWQVSTVEFYRKLGLRSPGRDFVVDRPIPDVTADLRGNTIMIGFDDHPDQWSCEVSTDVRGRVEELQGVTLGVTTALNPPKLTRLEEFFHQLQTGTVALGWIPLVGAPPPPLRPMPAPDELSTYLLHWSAEHATIGELLPTSTPDQTPEHALGWAAAWLHAELDIDPEQTIGWQVVRADPHAHYTMDALSARSFLLRRHSDGWKLMKILSRIDGRAPGAEADAREWAEGAVRLRDDKRIIGWVPDPTNDGFTTLHGSAAPRGPAPHATQR